MALSLSEAMYSAAQIWSNAYSSNDIFCSLSVFFYNYFAVLCSVISSCLSLHLLLLFVFEKQRMQNPSLTIFYLLASLVICLLFCLPALCLNIYGYVVEEDTCWFVEPQLTSVFLWKIYSLYGPIIASIIFNAVAAGLIWNKLRRVSLEKIKPQHRNRSSAKSNNNNKSSSYNHKLDKSPTPPSASSSLPYGSTSLPTGRMSERMHHQITSSGMPRRVAAVIGPLGGMVKCGGGRDGAGGLNASQSHMSTQLRDLGLLEATIQYTVSRVIFYALTPLICQFFNVLSKKSKKGKDLNI